MRTIMKKNIIFILLISFILCATSFSNETDISYGAVPFLTSINSPRAIGIGGASSLLVDEQSPEFNPAALGIFHLDHYGAFSIPSGTNTLEVLDDEIQLKTWNFSLGKIFYQKDNRKISIGISYLYKKFEYGSIVRTDPTGTILGSVEPYDDAKQFSIGVGFDYSLKAGLGFSYKKINSQLADFGFGSESGLVNTKATAVDFGLYLEFPFHQLMGKKLYISESKNISYEIAPVFSYVKANIGDDISYIDAAQSDPLPKISRMGLGLKFSVFSNDQERLSAFLVYEREKSLVYISSKINRKGIEIGLFNSVYVRVGKYKDEKTTIDYKTIGYGFSLRGLIENMSGNKKLSAKNDWIGYILNKIDIKYDWAKVEEDTSDPLEVKYLKITLSI